MNLRIKNILNIFISILTISIMLMIIFINYLQPMTADDFSNTNVLRENHSLISDCIYWYNNWTGRLQGIVILYFALFNDISLKIFALLNGIVFNLNIFLIYYIATGERLNIFKNQLFFILIFSTLFFGIPAINETVFWITGSITYLWVLFFLLLFLCPYTFFLRDADKYYNHFIKFNFLKKTLKTLALFILGFWVGISHEQVFCALIIFFISCGIYHKQFKRVAFNLYAGFFGLIAGGIALISAPGNFVRLAYNQNLSISLKIVKFLKYLIFMYFRDFKNIWPWLILILFISIFSKYYTDKDKIKNDNRIFYSFLLISLASTFPIFFLIPFGAQRTEFFACFFLVAAAVSRLSSRGFIEFINNKKIIVSFITILIIILISVEGFFGIKANFLLGNELKEREKIITLNKKNGISNLEVKTIQTQPSRLTHWNDISDDENNWINTEVANYYGISSIKTK